MRILFITSNRIGDAVLSTGLYAGLLARYPDAQFWVACGPLAEPIFRHAPRAIAVRGPHTQKEVLAIHGAGWRDGNAMLDLTVDRVEEAAREILAHTKGSAIAEGVTT